ncbi:MAG: hypothetical protein MR601_03255 [Erysipelotrichaceae bacterium]|nr:hypothetical protein [Erysipelotrichaceae bacterium]
MMKIYLKEFLQVRTIVTLVMVFALIYGWFVGKISSQEFVPMVTMILTFYFTDRTTKKEIT